MRKPTMIPPQRLRNPLTALTRAFAWLTPICVVVAAALIAYAGYAEFGEPDLHRTAAMFVIGVALCGPVLAGAITLPLLIRDKRRLDGELADIERGKHLLRWTYRSREWQSFIQAERAEARRFPWIMTIMFAIIGLAAGVGAANQDGATGWWTVFLSVFAGAAICGSVCDWLLRQSALHKCRRLERGPQEVIFGRRGLYFNGVYRRYDQRGRRLIGIDLLTDRTPQTLVLTFRCSGPESDTRECLRLPVPAGQEQAAQQLARCLK
jgi:hypothetical protein